VTTHQHRVLLVEDDADSRDALLALLEMEGFDAAGASSGEDALARLGTDAPPCVIFLDVQLRGGMTARDFRDQQLARVGSAHVPVILVSGDGDLRERARQLGARDFLPKPVDLDRLIALITANCAANSPA
jgi:CheY-like chemotaxis protein